MAAESSADRGGRQVSFTFGAEFEALAAKVSNWGRWGADDELGTINPITPDVVRRGAACVKTGRSLSLALPLSEAEGIQSGFIPGRVNPLRAMTQLNVPMRTTRPARASATPSSRWACSVRPTGTASATSATKARSTTASQRQALPASARHSAASTRSNRSSAAACCSTSPRSRASIGSRARTRSPATTSTPPPSWPASPCKPGDVVLVRTGHIRLLPDKIAYGIPTPGPSIHSVQWFRDHDLAAVATDNLAFEVWPCLPEGAMLPVHILHLTYMGMLQGQNWNLEALSEDCAADGVYEFLLEASPQPFTGAVGTPVNPIATK